MKRKTIKEKLFENFDFQKSTIISDCNDDRHIAAIVGGMGNCNDRESRIIFKEWLDLNKIKYYGDLVN